eukprot:9008323-Karenia_brevis.AAC.1
MTERRPRMPWVVGFTMGLLADRAAHAVVLPTLMVTPTPHGMQVHLPLTGSHLPPDQALLSKFGLVAMGLSFTSHCHAWKKGDPVFSLPVKMCLCTQKVA